MHLKNIYKEEELSEEATAEYFSVVQIEGTREVKRKTKCYNLDAIIAVGYRVNSKKATRFRQWATKTLKEYITKGFVLNDDMLKNFYAFVQNKLHFAVTGQTAAKIIFDRVDANKPAMGLTNWKDAPDGKIYKIKSNSKSGFSYSKNSNNRYRRKKLQYRSDFDRFLLAKE